MARKRVPMILFGDAAPTPRKTENKSQSTENKSQSKAVKPAPKAPAKPAPKAPARPVAARKAPSPPPTPPPPAKPQTKAPAKKGSILAKDATIAVTYGKTKDALEALIYPPGHTPTGDAARTKLRPGEEKLIAESEADVRSEQTTPDARTLPVNKAKAAKEYAELVVVIDYTNHRGERSERKVKPSLIRFGSSPWHKEPQWLLVAKDLEKDALREFAMKDIHLWKEAGK